MMYRKYFKRVFDVLVSLIGVIVLSPLFLLLTVTLWVSQLEVPFYPQVRVGKNLKPFKLIKFKTMRSIYNSDGNLLPDTERMTFVGKMIRKTSLDEIPQILNVLKGDMSLAGPRPLLVDYLPLYSQEQLRRHSVLPGITGWAQVNGRNNISWRKKFEYDIWYIDNLSFWLDVRILFNTFLKVVKAEGITGDGLVTERFNGRN